MLIAALCLGAADAVAQSATWTGGGGDNSFNTAGNWSPATAPGQTGTATFGNLGPSTIAVNQNNTVGEFLFNSGASSYAFQVGGASAPNVNLGIGTIVNNSSNAPLFDVNYSSTLAIAAGTLANSTVDVTSTGAALTFGSATAAGDGGTANIISNGTIVLVNTSTLDNATVTNSGSIVFEQQSTGGDASITNTANGIIDFSDTHGAPANPGVVSAGLISGGGQIFLGSNTLQVGGNGLNTTFAGAISDCAGGACTLVQIGGATPTGGSLDKVGVGTLTLAGVNTYTGSTTVDSGTLIIGPSGSITASPTVTVNYGGWLEVDGSITNAANVTVNNAGVLGGVGAVTATATTIASGGALSPGNNGNLTGTLTINGNLTFQSGAQYYIYVTPSAASSTTVNANGLLVGSATLAGTVSAEFASGSYLAKQYDILHAAGGLNGTTFSTLTNGNLPAGFTDSLSYSSTDVYLDLTAGGFSAATGLNINQQNVDTAVVNYFNGGGALPPAFVTLGGLTGDNLGTALTQLSGETATGAQQTTFDAMGEFMGLLTDPTVDCSPFVRWDRSRWDSSCADTATKRADAHAMFAQAPPAGVDEPRWSVWTAGFGGARSTDGNAALGSNNATSQIYGTAVGVDYLVSPNTVAGFAMAGGGTNFSVANGGTGRSDLFQAGAYMRHANGPAYVSAALAYGWQDISTDRLVTVSGDDQLQGRFNANAWSGRVEGGYRFVPPWAAGLGMTPYAAAQFTTIDLPAYAESAASGAPTFALAYGAKDATDPRSELGIRTDKSFALQDGVLTLRGRLAWAHDFDPDRSVGASFEALPGASFVVNGAAQASDSALTTASAEIKWMNGWSTAATFEGEFSNVTRSYAGRGVIRYAW